MTTATATQTITRPHGMFPDIVRDFTPTERRCAVFNLGNPNHDVTLCADDVLHHDATRTTITVRYYTEVVDWDDHALYTEVGGRMFSAADLLDAVADGAFRFVRRAPRD